MLISSFVACFLSSLKETGVAIEMYHKYFLLSFIPQTTYLIPVTKFAKAHFKKCFTRLLESINNRKVVDHKIEQLTRELKYGFKELPDKFDKILPQSFEEKKVHLENDILQELSKLVQKLEYVNIEERKVFLSKVRDIGFEYVERLKNINSANLEEGLQLDNDNVFVLNSDILGKIALL